MRYNPLDSAFFLKNRENTAQSLIPNSISIVFSNDIYPTNADGTMPFKQNSDLFYLTGIDQEETILIQFPNCSSSKHQTILFIKETNEHIAIWEGAKLTKNQAEKTSGISTIYWTSQFNDILESIIYEAENIYLNSNEHSRASKTVETQTERENKKIKLKYPLFNYKRLAPILESLRMIKSSEEIKTIQKACDITEKAFRRILKFTKPGVFEYEIEAEINHEFQINRSRGPAYASIIASGNNANVLHYISNNNQCVSGDLILMDFGAEYGNYNADLTRCIPTNGKFTNRQKEIYQSVLNTLKFATSKLQVNNTFEAYNEAVGDYITEELIKLKLLNKEEVKKQDKEKPAYRKYFMHGTSHYLGLDVHDVGHRKIPFQAGMVLTCEPGIYIPEEGIGIRLENDIYITKEGPQNLMQNIPIEIEEIEELMKT